MSPKLKQLKTLKVPNKGDTEQKTLKREWQLFSVIKMKLLKSPAKLAIQTHLEPILVMITLNIFITCYRYGEPDDLLQKFPETSSRHLRIVV